MIKSLHLQNFLSFGPNAEPVELGALNIIIGTNGSGKSNFIEGLELLRHLPKEDINDSFRRLGGLEIFWREDENNTFIDKIKIRAKFLPNLEEYGLILGFVAGFGGVMFEKEFIKNENEEFEIKRDNSSVWTSYSDKKKYYNSMNSIFEKLNPESQAPNFYFIKDLLPQIRTFRDWTFGKNSPLRQSQRADMPNKWLDADGSNLGLILNVIRKNPDSKAQFLQGLKTLNPNFTDFDVQIEGSSVQVFLTENRKITPALRLSDGTLRYLCLLALLCHPNPPPLVCIEEPEMGLHPDVFHGLAALMREASKRMQLVVTTHSDIFVDCFTDTPEVIKVCDKIDGSTQIRSLPLEELKPWLDDYSLGDLWLKGHIGGNLY